ncbi:sodium:proton antiporter [bacterium CPR1]|nr:sodium:proton antiporter [bacterium CPR1]
MTWRVGRVPAGQAGRPTLLTGLVLALAAPALALEGESLHLHDHWAGYACLAIFILAYGVVMAEEALHLKKSVPVLVAAGILWGLLGLAAARSGNSELAEQAVRHYLLEFVELFLFLLSAMTFINTMEERGVFARVRDWLISRRLSLRALFWLTGLLAFLLSPLADNLTTALLMGAVLLAVGGQYPRFSSVGCINIVVAANAGGAFSPFGDITTLMVWQKGLVTFIEFFALFLPSLVNWLVPAALMVLAVESAVPEPVEGEGAILKPGARTIVVLFLLTIAAAVTFHASLGLPPVLGMLLGLGVLKLYGYWLTLDWKRPALTHDAGVDEPEDLFAEVECEPHPRRLDIFKILERAEWDTLMFFCGVILCVGALGTLGYLELASRATYGALGPTMANVLVGLASALVDNIPVMVAVLSMQPDMSHGQWLLVTLTAGVGGSILSIGSAAGVALMGQARGLYTFGSHLRWSWAVVLGYAASILVHMLVNRRLF